MKLTSKVTPWLSFESQAKEAAEFYVSVIPDSKINQVITNPTSGQVVVVEFELGGLPVCSLNVGQDWKFTNAISLSVACETQEEIDMLWEKLLADGGKELHCGWLTDRYGLAWQIVPAGIMKFWTSPDGEKSKRMIEAMMQMVKLDMHALQRAFDGESVSGS